MPDKFHLTESEWGRVTHALRIAADNYTEDAARADVLNQPGLAEQFRTQRREVLDLAAYIEEHHP